MLGHEFDEPFFISPFAQAGLTNKAAESGLVHGSGKHNVLYVVSSGNLSGIYAVAHPEIGIPD